LSTAAYANGPASLWNHNGSVMGLNADGTHRQFIYSNPRFGMQQVGVTPGVLLFDGERVGWQYQGTAYVFPSSHCPAASYPVSGPVSADEQQVIMYGQAPVIDNYCNLVGYRHDTLVFTHLRTLALPQPQYPYGYDPRYGYPR
jgi:hypothetical protein